MLKAFNHSTISWLGGGQTRSIASFKSFFGRGKKESEPEPEPEKDVLTEANEPKNQEANLIKADFDAIKHNEITRLVRVRAYRPPSDVEERIRSICKEVLGQEFNETTLLSNPNQKFQVLTRCMSAFKHNVSNTSLNEIQTLKDVVRFFQTEQRDTSTLEDLRNTPELPKNLHINLEYNRFDPEKDTFFDGRDAYAKRHTIVPSLWYSKKYKSVYKKKEMFAK